MSKISSRKPASVHVHQAQKSHRPPPVHLGQRVVLPPPVQGRFTAKEWEEMWFAFWDAQKSGQA